MTMDSLTRKLKPIFGLKGYQSELLPPIFDLYIYIRGLGNRKLNGLAVQETQSDQNESGAGTHLKIEPRDIQLSIFIC